MILLTFERVTGPKHNLPEKDRIPVSKEFVPVVTKELSIGEVLDKIHEGEIFYNQSSEYVTVEYKLLFVSHISPMPDYILENARIVRFDKIKDELGAIKNI